MQPRTKKKQDSSQSLLKLDSRRQTQPPQTRRQYNYLSSYVDQNQQSTISPYRKLMMTPPRDYSNSKIVINSNNKRQIYQQQQQKKQQKQQKQSQKKQLSIIPFILSQTLVKQQTNPRQQQRQRQSQRTSKQSIQRRIQTITKDDNNNNSRQQQLIAQKQIDTMQMIKQLQRLKLLTKYLQAQIKQLKIENEQVQRQKRKLNENYISLLNRGLNQQQGKLIHFNQLKHKHFIETNKLTEQINRLTKQNSRLQNDKRIIAQQHVTLNKQLTQMKSFQQITQHQYKQMVTKLSYEVKQLKNHNIYLEEKMKQYEGIVYKREFQIQQIKLKYNAIEKELYLTKAEGERQRGERQNILKQCKMLANQNSILQQKINQLQQKIHQSQQKSNQTIKQISILLQIDHQKQSQLTQQKLCIETITRQLQNMKLINDQLLGKLENHQIQYDEEMRGMKRQLQCSKERQKILMESERVGKEGLEKKAQQIQELIRENQRLYKEINKLKFNHK